MLMDTSDVALARPTACGCTVLINQYSFGERKRWSRVDTGKRDERCTVIAISLHYYRLILVRGAAALSDLIKVTIIAPRSQKRDELRDKFVARRSCTGGTEEPYNQ